MKRIRNNNRILLLAAALSTRRATAQSLFRGISFPELIKPYVTKTYDPLDPSATCYDVLWESDVDGDGLLQNDEYVDFVESLSEGDFNETDYVNLPFSLKVNFVYLSCLCRFRPEHELTGSNCCEGPDGGINVTGADPDPTAIPLDYDEAYLRTVCSETQGAIDYTRIEEGITTLSPTEGPVDSESPTGEPTEGPSKSPTDSPSKSPSNEPSPGPTQSPAEVPTTSAPTRSPALDPVTVEPSNIPTRAPVTVEPSNIPTRAPVTPEPSESPTLKPITTEPSKSPALAPVTESPSGNPTSKPVTGSPSGSPTSKPVTDSPSESPTSKPVTESPSTNPTPFPTSYSPTAEPTTLPPSTSPNTTPTTNTPSDSPTDGPTQEPTSSAPTTQAPVVGIGSPTVAPATKAPIIGTASPTVATVPPTNAPSRAPTTKAPVIGTASPTVSPTTEAPIIGTGAPTVAQIPAPTVRPTFIQVPTVPTPTSTPTSKAPTPGGTEYPSLSSPPSRSTGANTIPPWYTPETPSQEIITPETPSTPTTDPPSPPSPTDGVSNLPPTPNNPEGVGGPGTERGIPPEDDETISSGSIVVIVFSSMFIAAGAAYLFAARRKRHTDDPSLAEVANKDLDRDPDDLEAGISEMPPDSDANRSSNRPHGSSGGNSSLTASALHRPHGSSGGNSSLNDSGLNASNLSSAYTGSLRTSALSDMAVYEGEPYDSSKANKEGGPPARVSVSAEPGQVPSTDSYDAVGVPEYTIPQAASSEPRSPSSSEIPVITGVPLSPSRRGNNKGSDSSSAGESGWSSSAGLSSLGTPSFDAGTDDGLLPGSPDRLLATISAADSAMHTANSVQRDAKPNFVPVDSEHDQGSIGSYESLKKAGSPIEIHSSRRSSQQSTPKAVTRDDLNAAIEAGDWAMVGATAALLADSGISSDQSLSGSIISKDSAQSSFLSTSSADSHNRTKELDRMVESGDWEGVVLAAAQFQGSTTDLEESTMGGESELSVSVTDSSAHRRMSEMRREVELLVKRVVPDEIDNIDEMMTQFDGREEELIETLRTMQERSVAQRARAAVQKTAKLEARAKASLADSGSIGSGAFAAAVAAEGSALGPSNQSLSASSHDPSFYGSATESSGGYHGYHSSNSSASDSVSDLGMTSEDPGSHSNETNQSSLELAIEQGDWRAVGEAAAMMGEGSDAIVPDGSMGGDESISSATSSQLTESMGKQERVYYLDALIAKGDWAGIVAAAGKYQAMDDHPSIEGKPSEEEREALAQADMWQTIANQSRQDSDEDAQGAVDAADWAISRSLEQKMRGQDDHASGDPNPKKPRIADDESV